MPILVLVFLAAQKPGEAQQVEIPPELRDLQTTVGVRAASQEKNGTTYILRGQVEVVFRDMKLTADEASFDETSGDVRAKGQVTFSDATSRLDADEAYYNVKAGTGWFTNGRGSLKAKITPRRRMLVTENPFYISAARVERRSETLFVADRARMTTCECEKTGWTISARRARIEVGDKVSTQGAVFRLLRVPLLYVPVTVNSIAPRPRKTGFLLPHIGNSSQKGFILGAGFYWAINPSADLRVGLENYSIRGVARNGQFRAQPTTTSEISAEYAGVNDKGSGPNRETRAPGQSVRATGEAQDIGYGFRGVVDVDYITSLAYRETWSGNFTEAVSAEARQTGFVTRDSGPYSLNLFVSRYQNFLTAEQRPGNSVIIRETPSLSFSGLDQQVGKSPLFFAFDFSATGVGRTEPNLPIARLAERIDFHPEAVLRTKPMWGFHITPTAAVRATHYGTSLAQGGGSLARLLGEFSVDIRPPSFEKVLRQPHWGQRLKHVVEADVQYRLVRAHDPESLLDVVRYDETDILAETNELEFSVTNSLLMRKDVPDAQGEKPQARALVSWRVSQKYYFDPTFGGALDPGRRRVFEPTISLTGFSFAQGRRLSPLVSVLKISPNSNYDTELRADFSPYGGILNAGITSHVRSGPVGLSLTDFFINRTAGLSTPVLPSGPVSQLPSFHLLRAVATFGEVNRKGLSGAFGMDFNFTQRVAHQAVSQVSYNLGCFAVDFEFRRFALGDVRRENQFRVAVSLANIGTFGNLKPREKLY
ncbi:MAG: LPS assembly protein LptD [Acidobacteria bacterium]|nr:LPS assembly protein LptD [Acidobacteriota bacterium]